MRRILALSRSLWPRVAAARRARRFGYELATRARAAAGVSHSSERAHDRVDVVEPRLPAEHLADAVGLGDQRRRIAGAARLFDASCSGAAGSRSTLASTSRTL